MFGPVADVVLIFESLLMVRKQLILTSFIAVYFFIIAGNFVVVLTAPCQFGGRIYT